MLRAKRRNLLSNLGLGPSRRNLLLGLTISSRPSSRHNSHRDQLARRRVCWPSPARPAASIVFADLGLALLLAHHGHLFVGLFTGLEGHWPDLHPRRFSGTHVDDLAFPGRFLLHDIILGRQGGRTQQGDGGTRQAQLFDHSSAPVGHFTWLANARPKPCVPTRPRGRAAHLSQAKTQMPPAAHAALADYFSEFERARSGAAGGSCSADRTDWKRAPESSMAKLWDPIRARTRPHTVGA